MALALGIAGLLLLPQPWNVVAVVLAAMMGTYMDYFVGVIHSLIPRS